MHKHIITVDAREVSDFALARAASLGHNLEPNPARIPNRKESPWQ
jgi:hypothetical protein